ncbi:hypothetical protein D3C73_497880 [compost metagenome]
MYAVEIQNYCALRRIQLNRHFEVPGALPTELLTGLTARRDSNPRHLGCFMLL